MAGRSFGAATGLRTSLTWVPSNVPPLSCGARATAEGRGDGDRLLQRLVRQTQSPTALRPKKLASRTSPDLRVAGGPKRRGAAPLRTHEARKLGVAQPPSLKGDILHRDDQPLIL